MSSKMHTFRLNKVLVATGTNIYPIVCWLVVTNDLSILEMKNILIVDYFILISLKTLDITLSEQTDIFKI